MFTALHSWFLFSFLSFFATQLFCLPILCFCIQLEHVEAHTCKHKQKHTTHDTRIQIQDLPNSFASTLSLGLNTFMENNAKGGRNMIFEY